MWLGCGASSRTSGATPRDTAAPIRLEHRWGDGALLQFEASASVVVRVDGRVRERSARARFEVVAGESSRASQTTAELRLLSASFADERVSVSLDANTARLTIPGSPRMTARTDDMIGMRRIDSLASTFDIDLSTRVALTTPVRGSAEGSPSPTSTGSAAAFVALLTPELPEGEVHRDRRWTAWHRAHPIDFDARCRARHELVDVVAGLAHVRWHCDDVRVAGIEARGRGTYIVDVARGVVVELDGRIESPPARRRSGAPSVEAAYSVHLDE